MSEPRYARFFKADLQMQTPVDRRHWRGDPLPEQPTDDDYAAAAEAYARRCYEVGLEIVGITDHNMGGGAETSFVPHLEGAIAKLAPEYGYTIVVFPGFEVAGPVGKGAHMLCLFEPGTTPQQVSEKLTRLGLPEAQRFVDGAPKWVSQEDCTFSKMLEIVQDDPHVRGLCIFPHAAGSKGVMDSKTLAQEWSQELIRTEAMLCLELPRPREEILHGSPGTLGPRVLLNIEPRYKRRHPIAAICSSDCKRLAPDDEGRNYIGFRHTWIKMSMPSVEGLRQAFLDHASRIRFGAPRPEEGFGYPKITRFAVSGAKFLDDQQILLSPNMSNLIGGGGTGKSTVIEYLRAVLGQAESIQAADVRANHERVMRTVSNDTHIQVEIERDGARWRLESRGGGLAHAVEGPEIPELSRFFPIRVYGQREIYAIAEDRRSRARLVDNLVRTELEGLGREASELVAEIRHLDEEIVRRGELQKRRTALAAERLGLQTKLERLREFEEPLRSWKGALAEREFLSSVAKEADEVIERQLEGVDDLELASTAVGAKAAAWPHAEEAKTLAARLDKLLADSQATVREELAALRERVNALLRSPTTAQWQTDFEQATRTYEAMRTRLQEEGADPEQYLEYERALNQVEAELTTVDERIAGIQERKARRTERLDALRDVWCRETEVREGKAEELRERVPRTDAGTPFVEVEIDGFGDHDGFVNAMEPFLKDRRRISADDWDELLVAASRSTPAGRPATFTVVEWVQRLREGDLPEGDAPEGFPWPDERRQAALLEWFDEATCAEVQLIRVPDRVVVRLNRQDGTPAGELEGGLSVGQRCTAILALLLTDDDAPVIVDQPEDEIDNEFIYRELVPMLRRVKEERQVIIATHDPNLPVNGDAELIHALEARDGRGQVKVVDEDAAVGALDRASVLRAVEDIMEGSEEAFRRRYVKYGF